MSQTQTILCPKGYLDKKDEKIIVNRVIRDDHNKVSRLWANVGLN